MRKKLIAMAVALLGVTTANAQFAEGKGYIGGSLTGLNMSYSGADKFKYGIQAQGGYMFADDIMGLATIGYDQSGNKAAADKLVLGVGGRYYIEQNGIYLGVNCKYMHIEGGHDDFLPGVEVGYAFFINRSVTIEPAIYYDQSFKSHSDYSTFGFKVGVGIYLFDD